MHELGLERDPTLRVGFPEAEEKLEGNCLEPEELAAFLAAMKPNWWGPRSGPTKKPAASGTQPAEISGAG
jgi:hypothetical protein